ncbi:hypothetical protein OSB04_016030 [Centaurea solstitialis]|uniref:Uncharacterized protein n=1 Tax=Centaurea solstitialis TaxID=347529 RepID=A0AA38T054_9ASTR|nr:hypothetical protein OSB04_016030 [Centaurea solstitialis]
MEVIVRVIVMAMVTTTMNRALIIFDIVRRRRKGEIKSVITLFSMANSEIFRSGGIFRGRLRGCLLNAYSVSVYRVNLPYGINMTKTRILPGKSDDMNRESYSVNEIDNSYPVRANQWRNVVLGSSFVNLHLSRSPTPTDFNFIIHNDPYADYTNPGKLQLMEIEDKVDHHHLCYHHLFILDLNLVPILKKTRIRHVSSVNGLICLWQHSPNLDCTYICNLCWDFDDTKHI